MKAQRVSHIAVVLLFYSGAFLGTASAQHLADRLASATAGDTLYVDAQVLTSSPLVIDRPITLIGRAGAEIKGQGDHELVHILADGVTLRSLRFARVGRSFMEDRAAVRAVDASRCVIEDNTFEDTFFGVYLARVDTCTISGNTFQAHSETETTGGNGIHSWYSRNLTIVSNTIQGHRDGIYLEFTEDARVLENQSVGNLRYGLHFMFSDRCEYRDNTFADNRAGVAVMYGDDVTMTHNRFIRAWGASAYGLLLKEIKGGIVAGNVFEDNSTALFVEATDRIAFTGNRFRENGWAIKLMANAAGNRFQSNVFLGNTFDVATNSRSAASSFEGNYWDRYQGYDLDRDGFGDVPFRPVSLFSVLVERYDPSLYLYRSVLVDMLDMAERLIPTLTPEHLEDPSPLMAIPANNPSGLTPGHPHAIARR